MGRPLIFITNDDGIHSPGLVAAVETARLYGDVLVAAPTSQQTASGRGMFGDRSDVFHAIELPLNSEETRKVGSVNAWHIDASPALVVQHGLAVLCIDRMPDLVVSGINYGENVSTDIGASGTVGSAFEAAAHGIPAIAVSRQTTVENHFSYGEVDWTDAQRVLGQWIHRVLHDHPRPERSDRVASPLAVLKIDIPDPCPEGTEERLTQMAQRKYLTFKLKDPQWNTPIQETTVHIDVDPADYQPQDDVYAVAVDGVVAVTPLSFDWTVRDEAILRHLQR